MKILSIRNLLCRKLAAVCWKNSNFLPQSSSIFNTWHRWRTHFGRCYVTRSIQADQKVQTVAVWCTAISCSTPGPA